MQRMHLLCWGFWVDRRPAGYVSLADVTTLCAQSDALGALQTSCVVNNGVPMTNTLVLVIGTPLLTTHRSTEWAGLADAFVLTLLRHQKESEHMRHIQAYLQVAMKNVAASLEAYKTDVQQSGVPVV